MAEKKNRDQERLINGISYGLWGFFCIKQKADQILKYNIDEK